MDPVRNPYSPGAGLRPPAVAGRDRQLADFEVLRQRVAASALGRGIVMTGLRGVGKTVLLNECARGARADGWVVAKVEGEGGRGDRSFREQVSVALNRSLREVTGSFGMAERFRRALGTFRSFTLGADPSGRLSIGIGVDPTVGRGDTGSLQTDLADLAMDLGAAAADRGVGVALFVDELQDLAPENLRAVCQACHEAGQATAPFYLVGAGLPSLPAVLADARSYAERLFDYWSIDALDNAAALDALLRPAAAEGVEWEWAAVELVVDRAGGYPYFLQEYGKSAWDAALGRSITLEAARTGIEVGTANLDRGFYASRWDRAAPAEREYMAAMAADGAGPSASGEVARRLGRRPAAVSPLRAALIRRGLVFAPERGLVAFTVPGMAAYVERQAR